MENLKQVKKKLFKGEVVIFIVGEVEDSLFVHLTMSTCPPFSDICNCVK